MSDQPAATAEGLLASLPPIAQPVRAALFAILRQGRPATVEELATATGHPSQAIAEVVTSMHAIGVVQVDEAGHIVAADGLSLVPTRHRLALDGVELHTWCAIDAVVIPVAIGVDAVARTRCGQCDATVELRFGRGELVDDLGAVLWFPTKSCTNVAAEFCPEANLFCDRDHLEAWRAAADDPDGEAITLGQAVERCGFVWAELVGR